jgi:hypothetical protein
LTIASDRALVEVRRLAPLRRLCDIHDGSSVRTRGAVSAAVTPSTLT